MSYNRVYPLILNFTLLGKATRLVNAVQSDELLNTYLDTWGAKCVVFKFNSLEEQEVFKKALKRDPEIKKYIRNKTLIIE
jgi:phage pi2 protein 07